MTQKWNRIDKNLCKFEKKLESLTRCLLDKPVSNSFVFALIFDICFYFRGQSHRVELYKILSSMNLHVIAIDYRGNGSLQYI
jgi:hypothetical protein